MKRNKLVLLIIGFISIVIIITWILIRVLNQDTPNKLANITKAAIWRGGVDEGFWFDLVEFYPNQKNKVRLRIYNDYNGSLVLDADFTANSDCKIKNGKDLLEKIIYFEFDKLVLSNGCVFEVVYPAYGGSFWEIEKNMNE